MKKLMVMVAALAMISTSAYAADWNFYGSARVSTFYSSTDVIGAGTSSDDQYAQGLQGNARIGATVKVSDELTGGFEYGAKEGVANIRKLYGEWNFGAGSFLVGQTYTPMNWFYSNQVYATDNDLFAQGGLYSGREDMLQLKFGDFKVALLGPEKATLAEGDYDNDGTDDVFDADSTETTIPGIEMSYALNLDVATLKFAGGYQTYEAKVGTRTFDVDSYVLAFGLNASFGAFYVGGNIYGGQNVGNMIAVDTDGTSEWGQNTDDEYTLGGGYAALTATQIIDNDAFGAMIAAGYTLNDMFNFEAGYGYVETEYDINGSTKDKASSYYLNATVTLAPGVFFVPEVGKIDGDENTDQEVDYFGVKWQINF